jgi:hypothetical protein
MFSFVLHLTGKFISLETPIPSAPRHIGQFSA